MRLLLTAAAILPLVARAFALDGQVQIHDPSTVIRCEGKYYTFGTGGITLISDDGWTWRRGVTPARRGMAPDIIHLGERYCLYVAANIGAQPKAAINMIWSRTLDPNSPGYQWEEGGVVASSDGVEDCNAIDPGVFLDPNFAYALGKPTSFVLFWAVTIVHCPREMPGVRLAIGSNAASVWWVNGQEVIGIYGDRQTVIDDGVSKRLTLKPGPNIVRCAVINGGGATDFCARFLDAENKPLKGFTVSLLEDGK